jgi:Zn-dependent protease with chaperone function
MGMTAEAFEALVRRTEEEAAAHPRAYRARVVALAALPYVYVFGALAVALGLIGVLIASVVLTGQTHGAALKLAAKGSWALSLLVYAVLRALWMRNEAPEGFVVTPDQHPKLFAEIEAVCQAVGAPPAHVVMIDDDFNAGISQHSRLGLLGWQKNHLYLGLPLMRALSPEQFRAVLAHEFGHLAGSHGRVGGWIYRSRKRWKSLLGELEAQKHWANFVFRPFFRWYSPYFSAFSFVRARSNEYEADEAAAAATSARDAGDALLAFDLRHHQLEREYWPAIQRCMDDLPEPDVTPHGSMRFGPMDPELARRQIEAELGVETGLADTHPALTDRLAALGVEPRVPPLAEVSAAEAWFGDALPELAAHFDAQWREWIQERWMQHYESLHARRERLAELDAKTEEPLSVGDAWEHAQLVEDLRGCEEALPMYRALRERLPDSMNVNFAIGRILVAQRDEAGIAYIERAIELYDTAIIPGSQCVVPFLREAGRDEEAEAWIERWEAHQTKLDEDEKDRSGVWFDEHYTRSDAPVEDVQAITSFLAGREEVARAWLLKRETLHYPERPMHVLIVQRKGRPVDWFSDEKEKAADLALQNELAPGPGLDGDYRILVTNRLDRKHRNRMQGFPETEIYAPGA